MKWGGSFLPCFRNKVRGYIILSYKTILKIFTVYFEVLLIIKYCVNLFLMRLHLYIIWVISKFSIAKGQMKMNWMQAKRLWGQITWRHRVFQSLHLSWKISRWKNAKVSEIWSCIFLTFVFIISDLDKQEVKEGVQITWDFE